jgi:hypothetical protein
MPRNVKSSSPETFFYVTLLYSGIFVFLTWSFSPYFYFTVQASDGDVRPLMLVAYLVTWPLAVIVPPVLLGLEHMKAWRKGFRALFLASVLMWPIVTLAIKIRGLVLYGSFGTEYWGIYPIFILLEVVWPILAVVIFTVVIRSGSTASKLKREIKKKIRSEIEMKYADGVKGMSEMGL